MTASHVLSTSPRPGADAPPGPRPRPSPGRLVLPALVGAAGAVHLALTPAHFREGPAFGLFFLAAAGFQLWLAGALILRPGPRVHRAGLWGSAALAGTWMVTRLIPPPGATQPEPVEFLGVVATGLEIAAIVALLSTLPAVGGSPSTRRRRTVAAAVGLGFGLLVLLASGVVTVIPAGEWSGPPYLFQLYPLPSWRLTGVWLLVAGRWSAIVPWVTIVFVVAASTLVAWTVSLSLRLPAAARCSARRRGVLAALPAFASVPLCCGAPFVGFAGAVAVGTLFRWTPLLMAVSLVLLAANSWQLRRRTRPEWRPGRALRATTPRWTYVRGLSTPVANEGRP